MGEGMKKMQNLGYKVNQGMIERAIDGSRETPPGDACEGKEGGGGEISFRCPAQIRLPTLVRIGARTKSPQINILTTLHHLNFS